MKLKHTYAIHCLVMFYEIEMFKKSFVPGILNMVKGVENPENMTLVLDYSVREDFENIDHDALPSEKYLHSEWDKQIEKLENTGTIVNPMTHTQFGLEPLGIAKSRRLFNDLYSRKYDILMWGETDSLFPKETFDALEQVVSYAEKNKIYKYVITFAYRKMWSGDWKVLEHPEFTNVPFEDTDEWNLNNIASEKCTMSIEQMNEFNTRHTKNGYDLQILKTPKFDGSCLVFTSEMIKAGINIPRALLMSGEDTSFAEIAKKILGDNYIQFHVANLLRVHNRRYPEKRLYIKGENNPKGFCGEKDKGKWWKLMENMSKENLYNLGNPSFKFHTWEDYFNKVKELKNGK